MCASVCVGGGRQFHGTEGKQPPGNTTCACVCVCVPLTLAIFGATEGTILRSTSSVIFRSTRWAPRVFVTSHWLLRTLDVANDAGCVVARRRARRWSGTISGCDSAGGATARPSACRRSTRSQVCVRVRVCVVSVRACVEVCVVSVLGHLERGLAGVLRLLRQAAVRYACTCVCGECVCVGGELVFVQGNFPFLAGRNCST